MPTLTIKNIPPDLYKRLRARAASHRRSLNAEVIVCLEQILRSSRIDPDTFLAKARELRRYTKDYWLTDKELDEAKNEGRP